jgi:hypothetical protein
LGLEASVFSRPTLDPFRKSGECVGAHTGGLAGDDPTQPLGGLGDSFRLGLFIQRRPTRLEVYVSQH